MVLVFCFWLEYLVVLLGYAGHAITENGIFLPDTVELKGVSWTVHDMEDASHT